MRQPVDSEPPVKARHVGSLFGRMLFNPLQFQGQDQIIVFLLDGEGVIDSISCLDSCVAVTNAILRYQSRRFSSDSPAT